MIWPTWLQLSGASSLVKTFHTEIERMPEISPSVIDLRLNRPKAI